ncbi:hypothetical protein GCM10010388_27190 [Streptomyces mauvecolor]
MRRERTPMGPEVLSRPNGQYCDRFGLSFPPDPAPCCPANPNDAGRGGCSPHRVTKAPTLPDEQGARRVRVDGKVLGRAADWDLTEYL